jgi:hypothetical protein
VEFLWFKVMFCVVLDVSHHLFFINNLKILNSNVLINCHFLRFRKLKMRFLRIDFSEDKRKNSEIFMFQSHILCGSGCEQSFVLQK